MAKNNANNVSIETIDEALLIAKKTQKPGQTKEQTRLIAQGIQKGIAEYKKTAKAKLREADKAKKKKQKIKPLDQTDISTEKTSNNTLLPWGLLIGSWLIFTLYFVALK